jgi:hypothetical protein
MFSIVVDVVNDVSVNDVIFNDDSCTVLFIVIVVVVVI